MTDYEKWEAHRTQEEERLYEQYGTFANYVERHLVYPERRTHAPAARQRLGVAWRVTNPQHEAQIRKTRQPKRILPELACS